MTGMGAIEPLTGAVVADGEPGAATASERRPVQKFSGGASAVAPADIAVEVPIAFEYSGQRFEEAFRADLVVDGKVILEIKSVETLKDVHKKQLLTYLRLTGMRLGFLFNFGAALMREGIIRIVNGLPEE